MGEEHPGIRAADADRGSVADLLAAAYAEGRLSHAEFTERTEAAAGARYIEDLIALTRDLVQLDDLDGGRT